MQAEEEELKQQQLQTIVHVGNASTGATYAITLVSNDLAVEELREELAKRSGIPIGDQILLGGPPFTRLDPRRAIANYGLPAPNKEVFLYDRRMLSQERPLPSPGAELMPASVELPSAPAISSEGSRLLSGSSSPLLRALADYESYFQLQVSQSTALEEGAQTNIANCEQCASELQVQTQAIAAAIANLDIFKTSMTKHFTPFWEDFEQTSVKHVRLLTNFESYLSTLSTITLHPTLATDERKTLYDCIPVDREREWAAQCEQSHAHVRTQVLRLQSVHDEICQEVNNMLQTVDHIQADYDAVVQELDHMRARGTQQAEITAKLNENLAFVMNKISETSMKMNVGSTMMASTNVLEVCRGIDVLYQEQQSMLPAAQRLADEMVESIRKMAMAKRGFFSLVHSNLRQISILQSKIRDFENSLAMLKEALSAQKKHFNELEHLEKLPESYAACLKEIARRVKYGQKFSDRIQCMAEELAHLREEEVQHREIFLKSYGQHLPRDFVPGLAEKPSHCEFRMRPFDQNLPQIEDVDESDQAEENPLIFETDERKFSASNADGGVIGNRGTSAEVEALQQQCEELEARVAELVAELEHSKKTAYFGSESGSIAQSDLSKASAREGDSSCEFPLVLALAATAGAMTSSSEADRSNLLDRELSTIQRTTELENRNRDKDLLIEKLERENQQFLLNAAAFEEYPFSTSAYSLATRFAYEIFRILCFLNHLCDGFTEIQERTNRELQLQENQSKLQQSLQSLRLSIGMQRTSLTRVLQLLDIPIEQHGRDVDVEEYLNASMDVVEARINELLASVEAEKVLRNELERRQDEMSLLGSEHDVSDDFKISFRSFQVNDLALFLPTSAPGSDLQRVYLAFHLGCPHRFLSEESISSFSIAGKRYPDYVVGRIVLIDEQVATETNNPYALSLGITFYVLTVASLHDS